jgi:hypothetical protein
LVALVLPWNVYFGIGVPGSSGWPFGLLAVATLLSWSALGLTYAGQRGLLGSRVSSDKDAAKVRLALNIPYLLLVVGFVLFAVIQAYRLGGTGDVAPGVGPGAMAGVAGALLGAQPVIAATGGDDDRFGAWLSAMRILGIVAIALATFSVLFNLYWRTRYALPDIGDATYGNQNLAVVATALVYGAVAFVGVLIGLRWLLQTKRQARLATIALGASTVVSAILVWTMGIGRDIDAFHGIAQNTSTAAIGFEGYLAWAAAAALVTPLTLTQSLATSPLDKDMWWGAARKCLMLIAIWCAGSAVLRVFDLIVAISLDLPFSPYDSVALLAFDVIAAAVAVWVRVNVANASLHPVVISALCGVLFVLTICRVVVGVGLAPRILYTAPPEGLDTAVYGNTLAHQITSTFDVVLGGLALAVLAVAILIGQMGGRLSRAQATASGEAKAIVAPQAAQQWSEPTSRPSASGDTTQKLAPGIPKIARPVNDATQAIGTSAAEEAATKQLPAGGPKIARVLEESTQRFGAGTTYTGTGRREPVTGNENDGTS